MKENKFYNSTIWILAATTALMLSGEMIGGLLLPQPDVSQAYFHTLMAYASFIPMWGVVIFAVTAVKRNRDIGKSFLMDHAGNTAAYLAAGLLIGFLLNMLCASVAIFRGDIALEFKQFEIFPVLGLFVAVFIQSSAEEVLCRGFLYQRLLRATERPYFAVFLNAAFFAAIHLFNEGMNPLAFYDMLITGIFFSLIVFYFNSLWMAMGIHATWNFTQSILLGLPNSGASFPYSIFGPDGGIAHNSFAYHTEFGLEGTILSAATMTVLCIALYIAKNKRPDSKKADR